MNKLILIYTVIAGFFLSGCSSMDDSSDNDPSPSNSSSLMFHLVASSLEDNSDSLIVSGDRILWFNATTKEMRFIDNYSVAQLISTTSKYDRLKFYIKNQYLFSSFFVSEINSQIINSLVFFYSQTENRFYLKDGYPDISVLENSLGIQQLRDENTGKIASEWKLFINQLKLEGRYRE